MSKSKDHVVAQEALEATLTNAEKLAREEAKHKRTAKLYGIAALALILIAAAAVVWNSGIIQKNATAAVVNGADISVGEMSYYYSTVMQDEMYNAYYYGTSTYDYTADPKAQMYDETSTYHDYFLEQALLEIQSVYGLKAAAVADGYVMEQSQMDSEWEATITTLESYAYSSGLTSAESYLQYNYGNYMDLEVFQQVFEDQTLVTEYVTEKTDALAVTDEALDDYYQENQADLDSYTIDYMVLMGSTDTVDENGTALSQEEISASLEEVRATQEENADAILTALSIGGDFDALSEAYEVYGAYEGDVYMGMYLNSTFSDWVKDDSREAGDMTVACYEGTDRYVYYVVRFQERTRDDSATASIRHIFVSAGYDPTQEEYDTAYSIAEEMLASWESGEATADSFGTMAYYYSADTASSSDGGRIAGVGTTSGYVDTFTDWCLDENRYPGETGLVINEASDEKGWHIMYFEEQTGPQWSLIAEASILVDDMTIWYDSIVDTISAELSSGTKYLG